MKDKNEKESKESINDESDGTCSKKILHFEEDGMNPHVQHVDLQEIKYAAVAFSDAEDASAQKHEAADKARRLIIYRALGMTSR
ncbi:MAG: hypothetical protein U0930_16690 [Pirellulales bacterium]